jgi:hypothetical protein
VSDEADDGEAAENGKGAAQPEARDGGRDVVARGRAAALRRVVERVVEEEPRGDDGGRGAAELQPVGAVPLQRAEEDTRRVSGGQRARLL